MAEHTEITAGEIHSPFQWVVANATARGSITAEGAHDLHKLCLQLDTLQVYRMSVTSPVTWSQVGMVNPMDTAQDLIVGGASGAPARLAVGTNGHVLTVVAGSIAWAAATGGFTNPMTTAQDLIVGGSGGAAGRLAVGTEGQVLTVSSGVVAWAAATGGMTNPMTTQGDIITGGASGAPGRLALGTSGHFLKAGATDPAYAAIVANDVSDATTPGKALLTAADVAAQKAALLIPTGPLSGFRNAIINGNFGINQRAVSGTVTLAAGEYGHDRWKSGSGGCTYTFSTSANVTTITITAGTLLQVIEGANLYSGTYVLSWDGTAQARIDAGSYGDTGVTGTATGGTNQTIEFGTGTVSKVQYEPGSFASAFELRGIGPEISLCQRYYVAAGSAGGSGYATASGQTARAPGTLTFPAKMRATPTFTNSATLFTFGVDSGSVGVSVLTDSGHTISFTTTASGGVVWYISSGFFLYNAEL